MRRVFANAALAAALLAAPALLHQSGTAAYAQPAAGKGALTFEKKSLDLGNPVEGGSATADFVFTNTGTAPITLVNVQASCGCTSPEWTRTPIAPGERSTIRTTFNAADGHPGPFSKALLVTTNGTPETYDLGIFGTVVSKAKTTDQLYPIRMGGLGFDGMLMAFGTLKSDAKGTALLHAYNFSNKPIRITGFDAPARLQLTPDRSVVQPGEIVTIKGTLDPAEGDGIFSFVKETISIITDDAVQPEKRLAYSTTVLEVFPALTAEQLAEAPKLEFRIKEIDLGQVPLGAKRELEFPFRNAGFQDLRIRNVTSSCGCTDAQAERVTVAKRRTSKLKGTFHADAVGVFEKSLTVTTNDPRQPVQQVVVRGEVTAPEGGASMQAAPAAGEHTHPDGTRHSGSH